MIKKDDEICLITNVSAERDLFEKVLTGNGFKSVSVFDDVEKAYQVAEKKQFTLFITQSKMPTYSGLVFVQKVRKCQNYGLEVHLLLSDTKESDAVNILLDHHKPYVLNPPYNYNSVVKGFSEILHAERNLSDFETRFRNLKLMYFNNFLDESLLEGQALLGAYSDNEALLIFMGDLERKRGNHDDARTYYQTVLNMNEASHVASYKMGRSYIAEKNFKEAITYMESVEIFSPNNVDLLINLGTAHLETQNYRRAQGYFTSAKEADITNALPREKIVETQVGQGFFDDIANELADTHSKAEVASYLNSMGVLMVKRDRLDEAIKIYESCLPIVCDTEHHASILFNIGKAYERKRDVEMARSYFEQCQTANPCFTKASEALQRLSKPKKKRAS